MKLALVFYETKWVLRTLADNKVSILASDDSSYVTGVELFVDWGCSANLSVGQIIKIGRYEERASHVL